ncbi:MAG: hypothetical protein OXT09_08615 [Myxococcales bacterium]|nr:hypothetical protein [Myxococcales bacterium]
MARTRITRGDPTEQPRAAWREGWRCRLWLLATLGAVGCLAEEPPHDPEAFPSAGLYTPGSDLGSSDAPRPDPCDGLETPPGDAGMATTGTLTLEYTTRSVDGRYAPQNGTAAWIETVDERYVATIELAAELRMPQQWLEHACSDRLGPDVVTMATLPNHETPHMAIWRGFDLDERLVEDGAYVLFIEVTESDREPSQRTGWQFQKGPRPYSLPLPAGREGALESVSIDWRPE